MIQQSLIATIATDASIVPFWGLALCLFDDVG
jgi:hypothetical protein